MQDAIVSAKTKGFLSPALPIVPWSGTVRALLMCNAVKDAITEGKGSTDAKIRQRWAALEAAFSHFIEGGRIDRKFLKPLDPFKFEHWTLRNRSPRPSLRVFGRFALPDVFVATHVVPRNSLGAKWSKEYEHEKLVCEDHWKAAGLPDPFTDAHEFRYTAYVTTNASAHIKIE